MPIDDSKLAAEYKGLRGPVKFRLFSLVSMPTARFAGLRLDRIDDEACVTSIPGGWRSQNPFKTMYWAVQGMGAELATGAAPFAMSRAMPEKLRMFVVGTEASFGKRAKGRIRFTCDGGLNRTRRHRAEPCERRICRMRPQVSRQGFFRGHCFRMDVQVELPSDG